MLNASVLIPNALAARDHADRLMRRSHMHHLSAAMKRRAYALEEAATRMELEAKARLLHHWRGQATPARWQPQVVRATVVPYVERRPTLRQAHLVPERTLVAVFGFPQPPEPTIDWAALSSVQPRTVRRTGSAASM
jgi:hypothetical protein